jgi:hypothetical protein
MCRTHTTQHELSAIAPNFQWVHLFASLGFADIRVGATSADIVVELVRTCTLARMHAPPCAACTQAPAALKPSLPFAYTLDTYCARHVLRQIWKWRRAGFCRYTAAGLAGRTRANAALNTQHAIRNMQHATLHMQHAAHTAKSRRASPVSAAALLSPVSAAALLQVGLPAHVCRWEWSGVTNRSSRLIIVVYSPRAAPARSCKQRYATVATAGLGDDFAMRMPRGTGALQWVTHRDRPIAAARPTLRQPG